MRYTNAQYTLFLLKQCNLQCPYCFAKSVLSDLDSDLLSLEDLRKLVDFVYTSDTNHERVLTIAGGEPSLHPEFPEIVDYLLSESVELQLAASASRQIPLGPVDEARLSLEVRQLRQHVDEAYPLTGLVEARAQCLAWLKQEFLN